MDEGLETMIRPSDKGPRNARPARSKGGGRSGGGGSGGGGGKKPGCWFVAVPAAALIALSLLAAGVAR